MFGLTILEFYIVIGMILCLATMFNMKEVKQWSFGISISLLVLWPLYILGGIIQTILFYKEQLS